MTHTEDYAYPAPHESDGGLTKREYFAAAALQGILAGYFANHDSDWKAAKPTWFGNDAVRLADTLIEALNAAEK